jgi:hypothetical protein
MGLWRLPKMGSPNGCMVNFMEKPTKMDENWVYPHGLETSISMGSVIMI